MKIWLLIALLILPISALAKDPSIETQADMLNMAAKSYEKADKQLNLTYNEVIKTLDPEARNLLITSEKAWINYRDAECKFEGDSQRGGSNQPLFETTCAENLTTTRIKDLHNSWEARK